MGRKKDVWMDERERERVNAGIHVVAPLDVTPFSMGLDYVRTNLGRTVKTVPEGLTHQ